VRRADRPACSLRRTRFSCRLRTAMRVDARSVAGHVTMRPTSGSDPGSSSSAVQPPTHADTHAQFGTGCGQGGRAGTPVGGPACSRRR
jgi:hypothetical protein